MDEAAVLAGLPHAVVVLTPAGLVAYANDTARQLLGEELVPGGDPFALVLPAHAVRARRLLERVAATGQGGWVRLRLSGTGERWVTARAAGTSDGGVVLSVTDDSEQTVDRRRLRRSEQRFRAAFEAAASGSALVAERGRILAANTALAELLGRSRDELIGMHAAALLDTPQVPPSDWSQHGTVPRRLRHVDGGLVHVLVTTTAVEGDAGERLSLVQVQDVTERRRSEQRLRHLALHDQLTDLPSRHLLLERLHTALEQRTPAAPLVAALFVDLDEFKLVNDALGHAVGDLVLREAAVRLRSVTRPQDTVARLSGDEFVVVCPALTSQDEARTIADRLAEALREPVRTPTDEVLVSASIGVAFSDAGASTPQSLLDDADAAMYQAKQLGRRRYEVFDAALRARAAERARVRDLVRRALAEDRVVVHYQPVVQLRTGRVVALEALLRLRADDGRLMEAAEFLDVAAESGELRALDEEVVRRAAREVAGWATTYGPLVLAVNLCAAHLDEDLGARLVAALQGTGLAPGALQAEVNERVLDSAGPAAAQHLEQLRALGVRLALDDFGTGGASLTRLSALPLTTVKVDPSLTALLPDDEEGVLRGFVSLTAELGLDTTAEGVETASQLAGLRATSVPYAQGHLLGGPVPAEEVPALLERLGGRAD